MKKLYIACMAAMALCTTSCMDFFPKTALSEDQVWISAENFQLYANQFYGWLPGMTTKNSTGDFDDSYYSDLLVDNSDDKYFSGLNSLETSSSNYSTPYTRIYDASLLLDNAEGYGDQESIATPMGEALLFRAIEYYNLVRVYGDVILVTTAIDTDSPENSAERNDRTEVIDQAISDLWKAYDLLPESTTTAGKATKYSALAWLSRIALFEGSWQKYHKLDGTGATQPDNTANTTKSSEYFTDCVKASKLLIDNGGFELFYSDELIVSALEHVAATEEYRKLSGFTYDEVNTNTSYAMMFVLEDDIQCNAAGLTNAADNKEFIWSYRYRYGDSNYLYLNVHNHANLALLTRKAAMMYLCSDGLPPYDKDGNACSEVFIPHDTDFKGIYDEHKNRDTRMNDTFVCEQEPYWYYGSARTTWTDDEYTIDATKTSYMRTDNVYDGGYKTGYAFNKFYTERQYITRGLSADNPIIRYAEVLLNYAEATYELTNSITDTELDYSLNKVRLRVNGKDTTVGGINMPALSNSLVNSNNLSMREEIRRERNVELIMECLHLQDLRRWGTAKEVFNQPVLGAKITDTDWEEFNWVISDSYGGKYSGENLFSHDDSGCVVVKCSANGDLNWTDRNYLKPIPINQIQLNPNLGQNPGWE